MKQASKQQHDTTQNLSRIETEWQ